MSVHNTFLGVSAGGKLKSDVAAIKVGSTGQDRKVGLWAGDEVELGDETLEISVSAGGETDGTPRLTPAAVAKGSSAAPNAPPAFSMSDLAKSTRDLAPGAYGVYAFNHNVAGKSTVKATHEAGATGIPMGVLAQHTYVGEEDITAIAKGQVTEDEKRVYEDSLKSKLHDWTGEDRYKITGKSYGLIISNTFDDPVSLGKYGEKYKKLTRNGGTGDRRRVKDLLKHLNIKVCEDHENVKSEALKEILEDLKEQAETNDADLIFVVVMSHGGLKRPDTVLMDDLVEVDARKEIIYALADNDKLREIPKIFLFNMCRDSWGPWVPDEKSSNVQSDSQSNHFHHSLRDTLLLFSTLPYEVSLRDTYKGAMYITEVDRVFRESAHQKTLRKMLYDTHMAVLKTHGQTPAVEDILFQDLKFKPKLK